MNIMPRQSAAIITFVVLIVLYCMPVLLLGWHIWDNNFAKLLFSQPIPQMVVTFNSGISEQSGTSAAPDLLSMMHRVLLPVATLISGLLAVSLSRSRLNYVLIGILLLLIVMVFATYVALGTSVPNPASLTEDSDKQAYAAISTVLSRTFDMLLSFVLLFLGIAVGGTESPASTEGKPDAADPAKGSPAADAEIRKPDDKGAGE